jgi:hypothetical protein
VGTASQTSSTPGLTKRPPSVHQSKLSANPLQSIVLVLRNAALQKHLLRRAAVQKIVSNDAALFD